MIYNYIYIEKEKKYIKQILLSSKLEILKL